MRYTALVIKDMSKVSDPGVNYVIRLASTGRWFRLHSMCAKLGMTKDQARRKLQYTARKVIANRQLVCQTVSQGRRVYKEYMFVPNKGERDEKH